MKKTVLFSILLTAGALSFAQKVGVLNGPSGIPMAYMMADESSKKALDAEYEVYAAANQLLPKLIKGEVDIGFLPPNVAAKVYNANGSVLMAAVSGNGMVSLVTKDKKIKSFSDLKGKTVYVAGEGATPDYLFRYLLEENNIKTGKSKDKVELDFSVLPVNLPQFLILNKIEYAVVPEPFSTVAVTKDKSVVRAIDFQKEFKKVSGVSEYPMSVICVNAEYAKSNPEKVRAFLEQYSKASEWTVNNAGKVPELIKKTDLAIDSLVAGKAVPNCSFVYKSAVESKEDIEKLLSIFLIYDGSSIGGKLPDSGFYFE